MALRNTLKCHRSICRVNLGCKTQAYGTIVFLLFVETVMWYRIQCPSNIGGDVVTTSMVNISSLLLKVKKNHTNCIFTLWISNLLISKLISPLTRLRIKWFKNIYIFRWFVKTVMGIWWTGILLLTISQKGFKTTKDEI